MKTIGEHLKQKEFPSNNVKSNLNILFTANWITNKISKILKPFKISHEQYNVLRILRGKYPKSTNQKDILERMIAPNSNITLIIRRLKLKKLVKVERSPTDGRAYDISITQDGLDLLKSLDTIVDEYHLQFNSLSEDEAETLSNLLDKLRNI